MIVVVEF